uniref:hypothetical protein n=1 Tax=Cereibacter sphaeroides TaxID=1063 RepID=UPI0022B265A8|nr:hypothetical protein [Cereibacter sphaeroides]
MSHYADWRQSLGPGRLRREAAGWSLAALTVAATATAAATAAFRVEELGHRDALQEALYLDLEPVPPAPAALAAPEAAPEVPQVEAPVAPEPEEIAEPEPELAPPPPDVRPPAETVDLPDIPVPTSETFAYDPPPPPPPEEEEVAEIPPDARPMPRPERTPPPEKKPEPPKREVKKAAAPPPQQAAAPTRSTGSAAAVASRGQVQNLTAKWGAEIRKRIQRHTRGAALLAHEMGLAHRIDGRSHALVLGLQMPDGAQEEHHRDRQRQRQHHGEDRHDMREDPAVAAEDQMERDRKRPEEAGPGHPGFERRQRGQTLAGVEAQIDGLVLRLGHGVPVRRTGPRPPRIRARRPAS